MIVTDRELSNPYFVADVRVAARNYEVSPCQWREHIYDLYRDYPGRIVDATGMEVFLDLEVFETPGIREWFRDWIYQEGDPLPTRRLRAESAERVRVIGTLLRAVKPVSSVVWGQIPANDNRAPKSD